MGFFGDIVLSAAFGANMAMTYRCGYNDGLNNRPYNPPKQNAQVLSSDQIHRLYQEYMRGHQDGSMARVMGIDE